MEKSSKKKVVNVVIKIDGGRVEEVLTDGKINLEILDNDIDGVEDGELVTIANEEGQQFYLYNNDLVNIAPVRVKAILRAIEDRCDALLHSCNCPNCPEKN